MTDRQPTLASRLIDWQLRHGRHDLPWQHCTDPYRVWLSEIMLQQTQVATVVGYFQRFVARFPDLAQLAAAPVQDVMASWSGLGYYARARNLHLCARTIVHDHAGRFPEDPVALAALPGIGPSTANAIAVFCFAARAAILDGNVKRVLCRHFGLSAYPGTAAAEKRLWRLAESLLPETEVATYIQAQMDLGATLCKRSRPDCAACPLAESCVALRQGRVAELPQPRPRKDLPRRQTRVLLLIDSDRVLLLRRPPTGIWGGLMSLPELPVHADHRLYAEQTLGCEVESFIDLPPVSHGFTHFHLTLKPVLGAVARMTRVADPAAAIWLHREALPGAALPAPIRALLERSMGGRD